MAPNIQKKAWNGRRIKRKHRPPADRPHLRVTYYPGEAARILGLRRIDYHQLRRLFAIIDPSLTADSNSDGKKWKWARYSFRHLVALKAALRLAPPENGGRLDIRLLQRACLVLREHFGRESPLTDTQLERLGHTIVARVGGKIFDATTGQRLIEEVAMGVKTFVAKHCEETEARACLAQVKEQSRELMAARSARKTTPEVLTATIRGGT